MPDITITRSAQVEWNGDSRSGKGRIVSVQSGIIKDVEYRWVNRFENEPGTNPEELIAAAHAACYSMAFSGFLARKGHVPESIRTQATCYLIRSESGNAIKKMRLEVTGRVAGLDDATFQSLAKEADQSCPVSNLLRCGLEIEIVASLA